jgi:hypothetical protein
MRSPPGATFEQIHEMSFLAQTGRPLPPGWSRWLIYAIEAFRTGREDEGGRFEIRVTLRRDRPWDLRRAWLLVDERVVFRASRFRGAIVDTACGPVATLTGFVPSKPPVTVALRWSNFRGRVREERLIWLGEGRFEGYTTLGGE